MSVNDMQREVTPRVARIALWVLTAWYLTARVLQIFPGRTSLLIVVSWHVIPLALFVLIHGALFYRVRGIITFFVLCLLIGNLFENLSIWTGFPFGHYHFTEVMGLKIFHVPVLLGVAYVGMGYLSWTLGTLIVGNARGPLKGFRVIELPIVASLAMVGWDLSMDPVWSTVLRAWIWHDGGPYFGVPVSNFFGWYLTVFCIFQLFAIYLRNRADQIHLIATGYWDLAVLTYGISAAGNLLLLLPQSGYSTVLDATGMEWSVRDITRVCALVSVFVMGAFTVVAWTRVPSCGAGIAEPEEKG